MKGLLIKDFKLMMTQKKFFFIIAAISVCMILFSGDFTFPLGFLTFVTSMFALSTISYDEFDNGNAFLFTLPITRRGYVIEKYCLGLMLGCSSWLFATLLSALMIAVKGGASVTDLIGSGGLMILLSVFVMQAIMFPIQLKFGSEKGRLVIIGVFGSIAVLNVLIIKGAELIFHADLLGMADNLPPVGMGALIAAAFIFAVISLLISLKISMVIMNKKEM